MEATENQSPKYSQKILPLKHHLFIKITPSLQGPPNWENSPLTKQEKLQQNLAVLVHRTTCMALPLPVVKLLLLLLNSVLEICTAALLFCWLYNLLKLPLYLLCMAPQFLRDGLISFYCSHRPLFSFGLTHKVKFPFHSLTCVFLTFSVCHTSCFFLSLCLSFITLS